MAHALRHPLAAYAASIWGIVQGIIILATAEDAGVPAPATGPALLVGGIVLLIVAIIVTCGFFSLQPGQAACSCSLVTTWAPSASPASTG